MRDQRDLRYLEMAYGLAEKAKGLTSPNPCVGAVIVRGDTVVGHGFHEEAGKQHAEIIALKRAGRLARGSTLYLTLEPCVHWGRTPPCIDALIRADLGRVVVSALDPNPLVYKKGVGALKKAGIDVSYGFLEEKNSRLNEVYLKFITRKIPFVTLKAALTLDGKTASKRLDSKWISSPAAREYVHLLRGEHDAIMVGIRTILLDDPALTVRHPNWPGKRIVRVVLDSRLRTPADAKIFSTAAGGKVILFTGNRVSPGRVKTFEKKNVQVIPVSSGPGGLDLDEVLKKLGSLEIACVLVEGGSRLISSFIDRKSADKLFLTVSPKLVGGEGSPSLFRGRGVDLIRASIPVKTLRRLSLGEDSVLEGYF